MIRVPILVVFWGVFLLLLVKRSNDYQIRHGNELSIPQNVLDNPPLLSSEKTY